MPGPAGDTQIPVFGFSSYAAGLTPTVKDADGNTIDPITITPATFNGYNRMWIIPTESGSVEFTTNAKSGDLRTADSIRTSIIAQDGSNIPDGFASPDTLDVPTGAMVVFLDNQDI